MDFSSICRTCLSADALNSIFLDVSDHKRHSAAIFITTGVWVKIDDGLPQKMCTSCINNLNEALKFREKAKASDKILKNLKNETENVNETKTLYKSRNPVVIKNNVIKLNCTDSFENLNAKQGISADESESEAEVFIDGDETIVDDDEDKPLKYLVLNSCDNSNDSGEDVYIEIGTEASNRDNETDKDLKLSEINGEFVKIEKLEEEEEIDLPFEIDMSCDPSKKRVTCKLCRKSLSVRSIDSHMASKHPGKDCRKVKCDLCDKYILKQKINRHKMLMHTVIYDDTKCLRCGYCKTEFEDRGDLVAHITGCTAKKKKRSKINDTGRKMVECDECHKTMQKASLRMHKDIKHAGMGPVCEHCGRRFGNKFRLNEHYRAKHGYDKFKCSFCEFQSAGVMAMRNHERRHRGEKPFVCDTCGAKFHAAYLLAQHKQSHRTERTIKCNLCPATFKANNSLHMHKITCHSKSLYKCHMCDRSYSCRHYVVKHLRHFHEYQGPVPKLDKVDRETTVADNEEYTRTEKEIDNKEDLEQNFDVNITHHTVVKSAGTTTGVDGTW